MKKITFWAIVAVILLSTGMLISSSGGKTGKSRDGCTCHGTLSAGTSTISIIAEPDFFSGGGFIPGETYALTISLNGSGFMVAGGFNLSVSEGVLSSGGSNVQIIANEATHTSSSMMAPWQINWKAPDSDSAIFYFTGNWANGDGSTSGDDPTVPVVRVVYKQTTAARVDENLAVQNFQLYQNYPNPFNSETTIGYTVPHAGPVELKIYDTLGRCIYRAGNSHVTAGTYNFTWHGNTTTGDPAPSGVYFYLVKCNDNFWQIQKLLLIK